MECLKRCREIAADIHIKRDPIDEKFTLLLIDNIFAQL
jgi:hypothetical protein